ncbi:MULTISPECIES: RNA polymerase sigma-70 factor [unclassified Parabacteroides]|uniref:RNA polymerase sigma-70 factor n=1 Tax=unclassified Parabacteroides TaxID=2649774 RepID=UPI00247415B2|nr:MULTISPECIES: RNA polymerase sigma-70 factor [unclassified Parabacteroides]MDH6304666.1 RNA polymerase sigma-70 factor (family 1) [Parabacteroides sp. PH5-39]
MGAFTSEEFEQCFKDFYQPLCLFALRYTDQVDDAEDVVQQTFADIWDKRTTIGQINNLKAYLYRSVRNRSLSLSVKQQDHQIIDTLPDVEDTSLDEQIHCAERDARLWNEIDRLPPERKKIFLLSKRDGLKYKEIAEELNISVKTVENQIGKALKSLKETAIRIYTFFFG